MSQLSNKPEGLPENDPDEPSKDEYDPEEDNDESDTVVPPDKLDEPEDDGN